MRGERSDTRCGCKCAQCHQSRLICVLLGQYSIESWTNHRKFKRPDGQTALYPKHDPSGGGFLSRLEFDGCRCVRTSAIQLRFSIYLSPFSLSLFLLFLISVFPSRAGVFLGQSTANDWVGRYFRYFRVLFPAQ